MPQKGSPEPLSTVAAPTCQHTQALVTVREPAAETASRARPPRLACPQTEIWAIDDLGTSDLGSKNVLVSHQNTRHARSRTHRSCFDMMAPDLFGPQITISLESSTHHLLQVPLVRVKALLVRRVAVALLRTCSAAARLSTSQGGISANCANAGLRSCSLFAMALGLRLRRRAPDTNKLSYTVRGGRAPRVPVMQFSSFICRALWNQRPESIHKQ